MEQLNNIVIEGARIIFRNFEGREDAYNRKGDRNFGLVIDDADAAQALIEDGWNVKKLVPKNQENYDDAPEELYWIKVAVKFGDYPPRVSLITKRKKTALDEENIQVIDYASIKNIDIVVSPYSWEVNGKKGVKAYLKIMYVTINEDEFADKYEDIDEA